MLYFLLEIYDLQIFILEVLKCTLHIYNEYNGAVWCIEY